MKKRHLIYIVFITIFSLAIFPEIVSAINCNGVTVKNNANGTTAVIGFKDGNKWIPVSRRKYLSSAGDMFCVDPHLNGPSVGMCYVKSRMLPDKLNSALLYLYKKYPKSSATEQVYREYSTAIRSIYASEDTSNWTPGTQYLSGSNVPVYTNTATVFKEMLIQKRNGNFNFDKWNMQANLDKYVEIANSKGINTLNILNPNGGFQFTSGKVSVPTSEGAYLWGLGTLNNAIGLYIEALEYAEAHPNIGGQANVKVDLTNNGSTVETEAAYTSKVKISISGMPNIDNGTITNVAVKSTNSYGSISLDATNLNNNPLNQNATSAYLDATITVPKSNVVGLNTNPLNFTFDLTFTYEDKTGLQTSVYEACHSADGQNCSNQVLQRMLVFENDNKPTTQNLSFPLNATILIENKSCKIDGDKYYDLNGNLINLGSEEANRQEYNRVCKTCFTSPELDPNSPEFNKTMFDQRGCCDMMDPNDPYYKTYCGRVCYTTPELNPADPAFNQDMFKNECCDTAPTDPVQLEYYNRYCSPKGQCNPIINAPTYCTTSQTITIKESDDFERCIWNRTDVAGNSYNISQQGLSGNPYCTVSCKEDYTINLPSLVPSVRAGQYFVLSTRVQGTRTCKSTTINQSKFDSDIKTLSQNVINAYNAWAKANAYEHATFESTGNYDTGTYNSGCKTVIIPASGETPASSYCDGGTSRECQVETKRAVIGSYTTYTYNSATNTVISNTVPKETTGALGYVETKDCNCGGPAGSCNQVSANQHWQEVKKDELYNDRRHTSLQSYKNDLNDAITALNNALMYQQACSEWNNDYKFNPLITYDYEEDYYMNSIIKNNNVFVSQGNPSLTEDKEYCSGTGCSKGYSTATKTVKYVSCNTSSCTIATRTVHNNIRVSQTKTYEAQYKPKMVFYTKIPTGEISGYINGTSPRSSNEKKLGQVFPVSMKTPKGTYNYTLNYANIGQYNDTEVDNLGRFTGSSTNNGRKNVYETLKYDNQYICKYNVIEDICLECGTTEGGFAYFYRPISLYDVFPNSKVDTSPKDYLSDKVTRLVGRNWTSVKGKFTQERIERQNAEAYSEAEYSFTLTPANMMKIREYNKDHQYNDFNLSCNSQGIDCTSNFLRDGLQDGYFTEATLNTQFIHANDVEHDSPRGVTICKIGENNDASCVGPSWK